MAKKFIIPFVALIATIAIVFCAVALTGSAENANSDVTIASENSIPENTLITYGYLQQFREELKKEIVEDLLANGGINIETSYNDISLKEGQILILSPECEVIYRGGGAIAITSSNLEDEGIIDMSLSKELFSGVSLEYGHIYYAGASSSKKAILVVGDTAYFTVRGDYDIG